MTKRVLKTLLLPIAALATAFAFIACDGGETTDVKFKVTYDLNGGTGEAPTETDKAVGEKFKVKSDDGFNRVGWTFTGWSDGSFTYQPNDNYTMPSKAVTFTAQWDPDGELTKYTVTYDLNGGSGTVPTETDKAEGEKFNLALGTGLNNGEQELSGWNDGTTTYKAGAEYEMPDHAVTFTAQWGDEGDEEPDSIYSAMELGYKGYIYLYEDGKGMFDYKDASDNVQKVNFTYTLNGTEIAISFGGNTYNGTYVVNGANKLLTIQFTYSSTLFKYGEEETQPTGKPTVAFNANGGTGSAPVIADADIVALGDNYKITLPQNTYTPPEGKDFDGWCVNGTTDANGKEVKHPSKSYIATPGEKVTFKALWKDAAAETPTGTEYFGNCHISVNGGVAMSSDFTVKAIMFDVAKGKMFYRIDDSLTYVKSMSVQNQDNDNNKPTDYGANAKFYEVKIEKVAVKLLLDPDNKLKLFDTSYNPYDNGEFRIINLNPTDYTITFDPNNEEDTWTETVSSNGTVQKPQNDPTHPNGKTFRYWRYFDSVDNVYKEYTFGSAPTGNITLTALYAWKITFSAGEGNGTIDDMYVEQWTGAGVALPPASDLNNGSKVFAGWWDGTYEDDEQTVKKVYEARERYAPASFSGNVDFVAQWKVDNSFTVGFVRAVRYADRSKVTGDDPDLPNKIEAGTTFKAPANKYTLAGSNFDGWELHEFSASSELGVKLGDYAVGDDIMMPAKPVQLVAKWKAIKTSATVTYKAGAHGTGADVVKSNVSFSTTYKLIDNPFTVENFYMFNGWKVEGDNSDSNPLDPDKDKYNLTDDVVFVAQYANAYCGCDNGYASIIYLFFDTSDGMLVVFSEDEDEEPTYVNLTVSTSGTNITITPEGGAACTGTFVNNTLNIELTVSGTKYTFGEPNVVTTKYTVTYNLNGGNGTVPTETDKAAGEKFTLAASTGFSNGEQNFAGWSDGTTTYKAGVEYTMPDHAVTLTAQWKSNAPLTWENIDPESGALFDFVNSCPNKEAIYLFDNPFAVGDYTFVGFQFYISNYNNLTAGTNNPHLYLKPIYYKTVDGKSATKAGTGLYCKSADNTDPTKLRYTSNSYAINVQTCDGAYYLTSFKYGSANQEVAMQVELEYTTKTLNDLKAE